MQGVENGNDVILCPVMNARRGQVYNALFRLSGGKLTRLCDDRALSIVELGNELAVYSEPVYLNGDGYDITRANMEHPQLTVTPELLRYQDAYSVAMVALSEYKNGISTSDAELSPSYLRLPQAERERNERLAREAASKS